MVSIAHSFDLGALISIMSSLTTHRPYLDCSSGKYPAIFFCIVKAQYVFYLKILISTHSLESIVCAPKLAMYEGYITDVLNYLPPRYVDYLVIYNL